MINEKIPPKRGASPAAKPISDPNPARWEEYSRSSRYSLSARAAYGIGIPMLVGGAAAIYFGFAEISVDNPNPPAWWGTFAFLAGTVASAIGFLGLLFYAGQNLSKAEDSHGTGPKIKF